MEDRLVKVLIKGGRDQPIQYWKDKMKSAFILVPGAKRFDVEHCTPEQTIIGIMHLGVRAKQRELLKLKCLCANHEPIVLGTFVDRILGVIINKSYGILG